MTDLGINIIKLRLLNKKYSEIKNELKCTKSTISYYCAKIEQIHQLKLENKTVDEILITTNIDLNIFELINQTYYPVIGTNKKITQDVIYIIQQYYDEGHSILKTSKHFKIARSTLRRYIKTRTKNNNPNRVKNAITNWRKNTKQKLVEYKGGKCEICGYNKSVRALTFHHINPKEKEFSIGGKTKSFDKLKTEVDKCMLLCSNCHCEIHDNLNIINILNF